MSAIKSLIESQPRLSWFAAAAAFAFAYVLSPASSIAQENEIAAHVSAPHATRTISTEEMELTEAKSALLERLRLLDDLAGVETTASEEAGAIDHTLTAETTSPAPQKSATDPELVFELNDFSRTLLQSVESTLSVAENPAPANVTSEVQTDEVHRILKQEINSIERMLKLLEQAEEVAVERAAFERQLQSLDEKVEAGGK